MHHVSTFLSAISLHYAAIFLLELRLVFIRSRTQPRRLSGLVTNEGKKCSDLSCTQVKGVCRAAISHNLWFSLQLDPYFNHCGLSRARWLSRTSTWRSSYRSLHASEWTQERTAAWLMCRAKQQPDSDCIYLLICRFFHLERDAVLRL